MGHYYSDQLRERGGTWLVNIIISLFLQMEQDPTNLYFSNLPKDYEERVGLLVGGGGRERERVRV